MALDKIRFIDEVMMTLGIIGLGLMGGSLALAVKERGLCDRVAGYNRSEESLFFALKIGMIDEALALEELIKSCDLIVAALPVQSIVSLLPKLTAAKKSAFFTDLGSTKVAIVNAIPKEIRERFVAAHPMAGTEYSGAKAAFSALYKERIAVLCDTEANSAEALSCVNGMFAGIGMRTVTMRSSDHDHHAAFISHLPHAISYALANSVLSQEDKKSILTLAAGGFRDMSRIAKSPSAVWVDIFTQNKQAILPALEVFEREFSLAKKLVKEDRWRELGEWMQKANTLHEIFTPR
ncbi:MAG: prephenate dehydrogenase [Helicobacteraceae bacterium]|jgi:prephenate dehydrogenase|nr:prephenate dehydrogenase [Helicobacteraceae bacterium]